MVEKGFNLLRKVLWIWSGLIIAKAITEEIANHKQKKNISKLPKYFKYVGKYVDGGFTPGRIYECIDPSNVNAEANFIDDEGGINGYCGFNDEMFIPSTKNEFLNQN
jgi:hypothetical protein